MRHDAAGDFLGTYWVPVLGDGSPVNQAHVAMGNNTSFALVYNGIRRSKKLGGAASDILYQFICGVELLFEFAIAYSQKRIVVVCVVADLVPVAGGRCHQIRIALDIASTEEKGGFDACL